MSDLDDLLSEARASQPTPRRGGLAFLVIAGVAVLGAVGATAAVAVGATEALTPEPTSTAAVASMPAETPAVAPAPVVEPDASLTPAPGGVAVIGGLTVYDETSDISLIPRPTPDVFDRWSFTPSEIEIQLQQSHLDAVCMAEKGFKAAFIPVWQRLDSGSHVQITDELLEYNQASDPAWIEAMFGSPDQPLGADYDWRQAGCAGASTHATGMDNAN